MVCSFSAEVCDFQYQECSLIFFLVFVEFNKTIFKSKHQLFLDLSIVASMEDPFQNTEKEKELETLVSPIKSQQLPRDNNSGIFDLEDSLLVSKPM